MKLSISEGTDQGSRDFDDPPTNTPNTFHGSDEIIAGREMTRHLSLAVAPTASTNTAITFVDSRNSISESGLALPFAPPRVLISSNNIISTASPTNVSSLNMRNPNLTITPPPNIRDMSSNNSLMFRRNSTMSSQTLQPTFNTSFRYQRLTSRRKNLCVPSVLSILLIGTIIGYICIWKLETKHSYLHVIFTFLIVAEISIYERWYTTQRIRTERDSEFIDAPNSASRFWAPWNDPGLQQRIAERQSRDTSVFDPEYPADFIPAPAYGNLRDSVLINPYTGRVIIAGTQAVGLAPPEYDSISLRSFRRSSALTLQQHSGSINTINTSGRQSRLSPILSRIQRLTNDIGEGSTRRVTVFSRPLRRSDSAPMRTSLTEPKKVITRHRASIGSFPDSHQNQQNSDSAP